MERVKYGYDRSNNRQWRENPVASSGQDEYYAYDGLNELEDLQRGDLTGNPPTGISGTPAWEEEYTYDPTGNWGVGTAGGDDSAYTASVSGIAQTDQKRANTSANEISSISKVSGSSWPTPSYSLAGYVTDGPRPLTPPSSYDFKWDAWNRLVEVKETGGSAVATNAYDGLNRRVTLDDGTYTQHFYYSGRWQVLEERLNSSSSADRQFVWGGQYVDDLVLRDKGSDRHYALNDRWNLRAIINTSGTVQERYDYTGFGAVSYMDGSWGARSSSSYSWETLLGGYRYDEGTGLYQVRNRYLHTALGRWLSRDPKGYEAGTNLYAYGSNNPINRVDPFGTDDEDGGGFFDFKFFERYGTTNPGEVDEDGMDAHDRYIDELGENPDHVPSAFSTYVPSDKNDALRDGLGALDVLIPGHEELDLMADYMGPFGLPFMAANAGFYAAEGDWGGLGRQVRDLAIGVAIGAAIGGVGLALGGIARGAAGAFARVPRGTGKSRIPWKYGDTDGALGVTDRYGNITIRPDLSGNTLRETVRNEGVHRFFSPRNTGPVNRFRAAIGEEAYHRSELVRYIEEGLAEGIATGSLRTGLSYPVAAGYVTRGGTLIEAGAYIGGTVGISWGAYQLFNDD